MIKEELNVSIRPVEKIDLFRFAMELEDGSDTDPCYPTVLNTLRQASNTDSVLEKCYIAEFNSSIIGFIYGFVLPNGMLIPEYVYVKPNYRKNGIAMLKRLRLEDIQVRLSPAKTVFMHYLKNTKMDIRDLNLQ